MQLSSATPDLARHLHDEMRIQERQLVWVRLAVVVLGIGFLLLFGEPIRGRFEIIGLLGGVAAYSVLIRMLLARLPVVPVAGAGVMLDMLAVTGVVWLASNVPDAYLFYSLVILGTAIRFGMLISVAASVAVTILYVAVVVAAADPGAPLREVLPVRMLYLVTFGVVAGLFSRIIIGRAAETSRLQHLLLAEEQERQRAHERDLVARLGRDFGASLEHQATLRAIVAGSAPVLGDATLLFTLGADGRSLAPAAASGPDVDLVARWHAFADARRPTLAEGVIGSAAATLTTGLARRDEGGPDGEDLAGLGANWMLATPIVAGGELFGVLATVGAGAPEDRVRRLAEALADRAGPALENARLWSQLQERVAREQEAQRAKDDFLSVVSHELRTPLTSIQGYSQLLEARLRSERGASKEMAHVRVILSQVTRMRRLVDDLLDVNRMERSDGVSIEPEDFDLAAVLRDAVRRVTREHPKREVNLSAPASLPVHLDQDRIDQVLNNLLENAVKYSPDGGPIRLVATEDQDEVDVRVADTGLGVPEDQRENIFERFYQVDDEGRGRRFGGLGLGLAISRAIVEAHGGRMWMEANTEAGRGSIFGFRVPARAAATVAHDTHAADGVPPFVLRGGAR